MSTNDITGDKIATKKVTDAYRDNFDAIFRKKAPAACTIPPAGWYCTRTPGHEGPCAAHPVEP